MIRRLFRALFGCRHADLIRERDAKGRYAFVCSCGYRESLAFGEPKKIKKLQAQMAKPKTPATVTPLRRAK
ncbi:MAG TPA: hypothetical protein VHL34_24695 [Rhizomicrobium sp.]|nr:hypothetical protein [Rhizomicrobium sp.]